MPELRIVDDIHATDDSVQAGQRGSWTVLVIDDDKDIHDSTSFALRNAEILGRPVSLVHCYSAAEARSSIQEAENAAVAIVDVVMEAEDAGLRLVGWLREQGYTELRIILCTGQPGYAPELRVMSEYEINDYTTKADLSRTRLISALTTALRSHRELHSINQARAGLELIVSGTKDILKRSSIELFATGVLTQMVGMLCSSSPGGFVAQVDEGHPEDENHYRLIVGSGRYESLVGETVAELGESDAVSALKKSRSAEYGVTYGDYIAMHLSGRAGMSLFVYVSKCAEMPEQIAGLMTIFASNISVAFENVSLIEQLDRLAYVDSTLSLPNRNAFYLEFELLREQGIPMNHLRVHINDVGEFVSAFGSTIVDEALLGVAARLKDDLDPTPYFVGADGHRDFLLLTDPSVGADEVLIALRSGIRVQHVCLPFSATVAATLVEADMDADTTLLHATMAMTAARRKKLESIQFTPELADGTRERLTLQSALREAIENRTEVELYLQPKVACESRRILEAEALCRWIHDGTFIPPGVFVPIAESSGLSSDLTWLLLHKIGEYADKLRTRGQSAFRIALNLSMRDVAAPNFAATLLRKVEAESLTAADIGFEVTESVMMDDPEHAVAELRSIRDAGFDISIDDFGTGYSSLSYLERLPLTALKIDRAFVTGLSPANARASLAATAIVITEKMGLTSIAEGIETEEQHMALQFLGCDVCQGYLYSRPVPMTEFDQLLAAQS